MLLLKVLFLLRLATIIRAVDIPGSPQTNRDDEVNFLRKRKPISGPVTEFLNDAFQAKIADGTSLAEVSYSYILEL